MPTGGTVEVMSPLAGPYLAATVVLAVAGVAKLARPNATRVALRTIGLPSSAAFVKAIGAAELVVAAWVALVGGALPALAVGGAYVAFALVVQRLRLASDGRADCGCFGGSGAPVTRVHVAIDVVLAGVAFTTLASPVPNLPDALARTPWSGLPFLVLVAVLAWVVVTALTRVPAGRSLPATVTRHPAGAPAHPVGKPEGADASVVTTDLTNAPTDDPKRSSDRTTRVTSGAGLSADPPGDLGGTGSTTEATHDSDDTDPVVGPDRTAPSADLTGIDPDGLPITVPVAGVEQDTVVAFLSSGCVTCQTFWDAFAAPPPGSAGSAKSGWRARRGGRSRSAGQSLRLPAGTRLVVVTKGPEVERPEVVVRLAPDHHPTVMATEAFARYQIAGAPSFVLLDGATGQVRARATGDTWPQVWAQLTAEAPQPVPDQSSDRDTV